MANHCRRVGSGACRCRADGAVSLRGALGRSGRRRRSLLRSRTVRAARGRVPAGGGLAGFGAWLPVWGKGSVVVWGIAGSRVEALTSPATRRGTGPVSGLGRARNLAWGRSVIWRGRGTGVCPRGVAGWCGLVRRTVPVHRHRASPLCRLRTRVPSSGTMWPPFLMRAWFVKSRYSAA